MSRDELVHSDFATMEGVGGLDLCFSFVPRVFLFLAETFEQEAPPETYTNRLLAYIEGVMLIVR